MSVLEKSAQIIDVLGGAEGPVRLATLAQAVSMPKSSTHRLLGELARIGVVRSGGSGEYTLGYRLVQWGALADRSVELRTLAAPAMRRLSLEVAESVHLHVPDGIDRVCVAGVPGPHLLRPVIDVGTARRLGAGAAGKLLLAFADQATHDRALEAARSGQRLPTAAQLEAIRARGWAGSVGELEVGLSAWAAVVRSPGGAPLAALAVSGATSRLPEARGADIVDRLMTAAGDIESALVGG